MGPARSLMLTSFLCAGLDAVVVASRRTPGARLLVTHHEDGGRVVGLGPFFVTGGRVPRAVSWRHQPHSGEPPWRSPVSKAG